MANLFVIGNGLAFLRPRQELFSWFARCNEQYGYETLAINIPTLPPGLIISNPANLEHIFRNEEIFQKGDFFRVRLHDLFGHGIVNVDGHLWKQQRKAGTQFFNANTIKKLTQKDLPEILQNTIAHVDSVADETVVIDLESVLHEATTQLIGRLAYDTEMHANDDFTQAFDGASEEIARRFQNPFWKLTELATGRRLRACVSTMKQYGQELVEQAERRRKCSDGTHDDTAPILIHTLLDHLNDRELVADSALSFLSAGKDTIAQALTWTFYLLTSHQDVSDKIFHMVKNCNSDVVKQEDIGADASNFILAVFYEALRLYPPIPIEMKQAQEDTVLPDGTFIPQDSVVLWCTWAMNRSNLTWGSDAEHYRPDRWLQDGVMVQRSAAEFPVFQGGARLCLGKKMADLIAVQVIATLTKAFAFSPCFEGEKTSRTHLTMPMDGGLQIKVGRRHG
ncbi:hypothetical protein NW762_013932 [Fusarium torreyae]|uniref:Cytochrome P450 n=1 Tax=Fusarium torreyae TaxID=1237075 RepID=A0A9W8RMS7_9HYPO|nr:hypothetical protein NW762_013932 [Fusarium torreyae]